MLKDEVDKIASLESKDIEDLKNSYSEWISERDVAVRLQIDDLIRDKRVQEIMKKRKSLQEQERLLFFFENMDKHELELQEAESKIEEVRRKSQVEEEYIPPKLWKKA
jgi:uncharacterized HAD superfamily protein